MLRLSDLHRHWRRSLVPIPTTSRNLSFGRTASLILPRLYLSDYFTAQNDQVLASLEITHVVSVLEHPPTLPDSIPAAHRLHIRIPDVFSANILIHFEETTEFIRRALDESESNTVLVHCYQGISRSAAIVCAYVLATADYSMTASEAVMFVQSKRGIACPNLGFRHQLEAYATRFAGRPKSGLRRFRISVGIAERVRRLKAGSSLQLSKPSEASQKDVLNG